MTTHMKTRKQLPNFGYLSNMRLNITSLLEHLQVNNMLNSSIYNDIKVSSNSAHKDFVIANEFSKNNFFKEHTAADLEGEKYVQLYLTDFDKSKKSKTEITTKPTTIFSRTKRLNRNHPAYLPESDELNYGIRNHYVSGILSDILDSFYSKVTRVRLAYLKSNFSIKPHVDYDPSYIVRYHVPIITNTDCRIHIQIKDCEYSTHFPADGRVFFLNAGHLHWASNNSNVDRLHLIIDVHGQAELENLIEFK